MTPKLYYLKVHLDDKNILIYRNKTSFLDIYINGCRSLIRKSKQTCFLSYFLNFCKLVICLILSGKLFHFTGPDLQKALSPNDLYLVFETNKLTFYR